MIRQLSAVYPRELVNNALSLGCQMDLDPAAVRLTGPALHHPELFASRNQGDCPVMVRLKLFRELSHGSPITSGKTLDVQQEQVLQRRDSLSTDDVLAEAEEPPQLITKFR